MRKGKYRAGNGRRTPRIVVLPTRVRPSAGPTRLEYPMKKLILAVALGAVATWAVGQFAGWQVSMTATSILLATGFSAFVGVFFGFYPARKASKLLPIQALRYE